ncbi:MAG: HAMP domain-containing histidine kinase, partial [Pseudobdellovibrionaceae bacterium]|nr:HAMP domain-containing histidine kinase [Pseudobdellovibrionaceae bacterium]
TQELIARIAAHLKMAKVRDEAARRERQLLAEVEGARRSNEIKDEFLATISHELRTPMNAILGFSHLLREEEPGSVFFDNAVDAVIRNAEQQNRIISDLLDISRIITGKMKFEVKDLYIEDTISAAIESLSLSTKARDIKVVWIPSRQPHRIIGDPGRLQQMMWNILSNAIRFSKANDVINIILKPEGEAIRITVKDQGEGISPEFLPFACDPLRQEDGSHTRPYGGLGLGLKIVQEIIAGHGGQVTIASSGKGRGTTVSVLLPIQFGQAGNIMHLSKVSGLPHEFQQL